MTENPIYMLENKKKAYYTLMNTGSERERRGDYEQEADPVRGICGAHGGHERLPKCVMLKELIGGAGCVGGQEKEWTGCLPDDLRTFGINAHQWKWRKTAEQGAESFMAKLIAAEKVRAGLRHAVSMSERDGKDQGQDSPNKRARAGPNCRS